MHYMEIGGAESALLGLLMAIDYSRYDVDLFLYAHRGELMNMIPKEVNLLPEVGVYSMIEQPIVKALKHRYFRLVWRRMLAKWQFRRYRKHTPAKGDDSAILQYIGDCVTPLLPAVNPGIEYDLAISFLAPHNIVRDKVRAKKKLAWIHTDYSTVSINVQKELPVWDAFDYIASISQDVRMSFTQIFPSLSDKIIDIENILSSEYVRTRALEFDALSEMDYEQMGGVNLLTIGRYAYQKNLENIPFICARLIEMIKLLSIGRFCQAKNYDNVPDICRQMLAKGAPDDLRWYIIGYGGDEALIRSKIAENGMENHVILLGKKVNPYPYIKACDIYVQPSRYEGKSVTVREAQMLYKPVVVTAYPTAPSQIKDGVDGVIVPLDNEGCARGLADFIANRPLRESICTYLRNHDFGNESEIEKIYNLIE